MGIYGSSFLSVDAPWSGAFPLGVNPTKVIDVHPEEKQTAVSVRVM
ncbi:hypothetical protein [Flexithrix dorotheae]|nr:hypothetical protein [Flexithrix dorotheae]